MQRKTGSRGGGRLGVLLAAAAGIGVAGWSQEAQPRLGFETGPENLTALVVQGTELKPDPEAEVSVTREAGEFKEGMGALCYRFPVRPGPLRVLAGPVRLGSDTASVRLWARSSHPASLLFQLRERDGSTYQLAFSLPAQRWSEVRVNLNEFLPDKQGMDENGRLDPGEVEGIGVLDLATLLVNAPEAAAVLPHLQGEHRIWLDDIRFSKEREPVSAGVTAEDGGKAVLVDNFETGLMRWLPVRVRVENNAPSFQIFPAEVQMEVLKEAAGPGTARTPLEPGGLGLRYTYQRGAGEVFALHRDLEGLPLGAPGRLQLSLNVSRKSYVAIQVKERDGSEYSHAIGPENSTGWQNHLLLLSGLKLSDSSQDENNMLDPDQIKELTLLDASAFAGLEGGETTMEVDAVAFRP